MAYIDYLNQAFSSKQYQDAASEYEKAAKRLEDLNKQAPNYAVNKQRELLAADPEAQRLIAEQAKSRGQLFAEPFQARDRYKDIFDPTRREALVSQAIGNVLGQLSGYGESLGIRKQTATDRANQALELLKAQIGAAEGEVQARGGRLKELGDTLKDVARYGYQEERDRANRARAQADKTYSGTYTNEGGEIVRYELNPKTGEVQNFVIGKGQNEQSQAELDNAAQYDIYANELESGNITPDKLRSLLDNKAISPQVYSALTENIQSGVVSLPSRRPTTGRAGSVDNFLRGLTLRGPQF